MLNKRLRCTRRKSRIRYNLKKRSSSGRMRISFYTSNKYIYSQVIDESKKITITSLCTSSPVFKSKNNIEASSLLGERLAKLLLQKSIKDVYFDRGERKYHGKAKAFAESARKNGLNF